MTTTTRPIFDAHLDLAWCALQWNRDLTQPLADLRAAESHVTDHAGRGKATVSFPELKRARVGVCLATVLVRCKPDVNPAAGASRRDLDFRTQEIAHSVGQGQLAYYHLMERRGVVRILRTAQDLASHWKTWVEAPDTTPLGVIIAMEGADPIVSPDHAADWFAQGLRCVGLAHYGPSAYAVGTGFEGPLTDAGRAILKEFERLGVILDLTHCSEPGFSEALDRFGGRIHASHNMCRTFVDADRQFTDEQIKRLLSRDAVIGMAWDAWMLVPGWRDDKSRQRVSFENVADNVDHVCQIAGDALHVGIGSDLDGGFGYEQTPREMDTIADLQKLGDVLTRRGYSAAQIDGVFHGNWLRFFAEALPGG
jgi:membrane dipeptidase